MSSIYRENHNCWRTGKADKAALLIDCANFFRALYAALCDAKKSIFILGWDIDGRIELLRGEEGEDNEIPVTLFDLLTHKAEENQDLQIYLNRWNYSVFFTTEREPFSGWKWRMRTPANIHYCADYTVPFSACHHQKVIVIDDEIAFCGGIDIALGRWDQRQHRVRARHRVDPGGWLDFFRKKSYHPHHDIQLMMTGPIVGSFAELARERWKTGAKFDAIRPALTPERSGLWPAHVTPDFEDIDFAIARTLPKTADTPTVREIQRMYIDEIARAEKFIYIENQYLTCPLIAKALQRRLWERPELAVLAVSSDVPRGYMEHKSMWTGRVAFCDTVTAEMPDNARFAVTYPLTAENGREKTIHIHSKVMFVDERFLHIGSSNMNNRSMGFDTECDVIIEAQDDASRARIAKLRNNLIREHTGREEKDIAALIAASDLDTLLEYQPHSRQHLQKIDNGPYRNGLLTPLAIKLGDPKEAHLLVNLPVRQILFFSLALALIGVLAWLSIRPFLPDEFLNIFSEDGFRSLMENARQSSWSPLILIGLYLLGGAFFFSVMALNLVTAIVFGPVYGFLYAYLGSLTSAAVAYAIGRGAGAKLSRWFKPVLDKMKEYTDRGGVLGMTMVRMVPIAPFTAINVTLGMAQAGFAAYMISTFLGLLPGIAAKSLFGGALGELFSNPEPEVIFYTIGTLTVWMLILWGTHRIFKHYRSRKAS
ncbi:VTT domain-containing protein [Sneathiella sp.]|uniref:VTT domain-containing protein n=1 Tax=Sneathiella sp. TaxID=1964365 RepID=UPI002FE214AC